MVTRGGVVKRFVKIPWRRRLDSGIGVTLACNKSALSFVKTSCTESNQNRFVCNLFRCGLVMRKLIAPLAFVVLVIVGLMGLAFPAGAETKIFLVENQPDGYGIDQCLASGANCGKPMASAYCQSRKYGQALSFRKAEPDEITGGGASASAICHTRCADFVAIECIR
jgi:hypothetical protein